MRLWDTSILAEPRLKETFRDHENIVFGVAFSPDNAYLASVDWNDKVLVRKVADGKEVWSWKR